LLDEERLSIRKQSRQLLSDPEAIVSSLDPLAEGCREIAVAANVITGHLCTRIMEIALPRNTRRKGVAISLSESAIACHTLPCN
jgi:hypothetical protein